MSEKRKYVGVFPDGSEHAFEVEFDPKRSQFFSVAFRSAVERIVRDSPVRTKRANPQEIEVRCFELMIVGTKLESRVAGVHRVMPYLEPMTEEEFNTEQEELLKDIPEEFHPNLRTEAWDRGHSAGMEEVIGCLRTLINVIEDPLRAYTARIQKK